MATFVPSYDISPSEALATPRFSKLFTCSLGSPFLTTADLPADDPDVRRASTALVETDATTSDTDMETVDGAFAAVPRSYTVTRPPSPTPSFRTETFSIVNWTPEYLPYGYFNSGDRTPRCSVAFLPSPARRTVAGYPSTSHFRTGALSTPSPLKSSRSLSLGIIPRIWDALKEGSPSKKGKRRPALPSASIWRDAMDVDYASDGSIDYMNMMPLDGEEGELIDDEACFIDVRAIIGVDIVSYLPPELALHLLSFLDLPAVLACLRVSRTWHRFARDNAVWRELFEYRKADGWCIDLRRAHKLTFGPLSASKMMLPAPLEIDWYATYRARAELDRRWSNSCSASVIADMSGNAVIEQKEAVKAWEPRVMRMSGHLDSVYCLEFDSSRIITGSRDRTIKVWSLKTGKCLGTFAGHRGSVLCLKFDKDWDLGEDDDTLSEDGLAVEPRKGFMVSGSSDYSICVWDLYATPADHEGEMQVSAEIQDGFSKDALIRVWDRRTLALHCTFRGHEGPVNAVGLQGTRVVSASGDGKMMLWDIASGERLRTIEGHDRGLACIEFKDDLIVSGSNDCKIKVWSASTGACLQTLVGHDLLVRALSFDPRNGRLISGSYDKTVKVWDLRTGRMVREFRGCHVSHIFDVKFDHCRIVSTSHDQKIPCWTSPRASIPRYSLERANPAVGLFEFDAVALWTFKIGLVSRFVFYSGMFYVTHFVPLRLSPLIRICMYIITRISSIPPFSLPGLAA
ncbi:F-box/WD repeat-containing protein pof11 [Grifola frondosa]|uniref:F-box/WD repeat-containing protein pof11 n=1 Tax=Grifola frondosa TaxID=5627 RepID=A0A1C7MIA5_GRIFR|nr:F-box/WD repeat-containing protein pof11 [Grifola frondosa]